MVAATLGAGSSASAKGGGLGGGRGPAGGNGSIGTMGAGTNDFTGDGKDDLLAFYDYGSGEAALFVYSGTTGRYDGATDLVMVDDGAVWRFSGTPNAGENATRPQQYSAIGAEYARSKMVMGDYDGNGMDDLIFLVDRTGGAASLWVLPGGQDPTKIYMWRVWFCGPGNFWPSVTKVA